MNIWQPVLERESNTISFFEASVSAGFPSPAEPHLDSQLDLHTHLVKKPSSTFFTRAAGNSMEGRGIMDGAILIVDKSLTPRDNDIVVAVVGGEMTVKTLRLSPPRLVPANENYPTLHIRSDDVEVWGVVTAVVNQYRK